VAALYAIFLVPSRIVSQPHLSAVALAEVEPYNNRMSTKQIASSTLWQVASQVTMAALSVITVKLVATGLTKELAGEYNTAYGFLQIFGILADYGLYAVAVPEVSKAKKDTSAKKAISKYAPIAEYEKKNSGKKKIKARDGQTGYIPEP